MMTKKNADAEDAGRRKGAADTINARATTSHVIMKLL
jgi:hypothetical protein